MSDRAGHSGQVRTERCGCHCELEFSDVVAIVTLTGPVLIDLSGKGPAGVGLRKGRERIEDRRYSWLFQSLTVQ